VPVGDTGAKPANARGRRPANSDDEGRRVLDLASANRYSLSTRGSMEMFAEHFRHPLASIRSLSNRPVNSRWRSFPPSLAWRPCRGWQPAVGARWLLATCLTEPPPSGFIMPVVTMASAAPRL